VTTARLFVAIDPPEQVRRQITPLCRDLDGARWTRADQLHVTLRFLGTVDAALVGNVVEGLGAIARSPFSLTAAGFGVFPSFRSPKVLWIGLSPAEGLERLHEAVESSVVRSTTLEPDEKRFSPHLTLARLNGARASSVRAWMERRSNFSAGPWEVDGFFLYASTLTPSGAIHRKLETYRLAGAPAEDRRNR